MAGSRQVRGAAHERIGASVGRAVGGLGGPATTAIRVVAGGIVVGALGGGFVASGGLPGAASRRARRASSRSTRAPTPARCSRTMQAGQQVLATGRNEDSTWLRIHYPSPGRTEAWVEAGPLTVDGSVAEPAGRRVRSPELAIAPPSLDLPEESLTAVQDNPPSAADAHGHGHAHGPTADPPRRRTPGPTSRRSPPRRARSASTPARYCPNAVKSVTFRVKATDTGGVTGVTLFWREPGAADVRADRDEPGGRDGEERHLAGDAGHGRERDRQGRQPRLLRDRARRPGGDAPDPGDRHRHDPGQGLREHGPGHRPARRPRRATPCSGTRWASGNCQTATNITATIKDPDGVGSATPVLPPAGRRELPVQADEQHDRQGQVVREPRHAGRQDHRSSRRPPTTLRWYIRATDSKGKATNQDPTGR